MPSLPDAEVFRRQVGIFNPEQHQRPITIIGCGATGSYVALVLVKLGLRDFTLYDADRVEPHNCPNQLHSAAYIGLPKVEATENMMRSFEPTVGGDSKLRVQTHNCFYEGQDRLSGIVVCAVDTMEARQTVWDNVRMNPSVTFFIDPRMAAQSYHLYTASPVSPECISLYESSLHSDEEADEPVCGEQSIIDSVVLLSSRIAHTIRCAIVEGEANTLLIEDLTSDAGIQFTKAGVDYTL